MLPILIRKINMTVKAAEVSNRRSGQTSTGHSSRRPLFVSSVRPEVNSWLFQLTGAVKLCHAQKITGFRFIGVFVTEVIK